MLNNVKVRYHINKLRAEFVRKCKEKMSAEQRIIPADYRKELEAYWSKYNVKVDYSWHALYLSKCNIRNVRCIPEDIFYLYMIPKLNQKEFSSAYKDKSFYDMRFPMVKRPNSFVKNVNGIFFGNEYQRLTFQEALERCMGRTEFIIKPSLDSGRGKGFEFVSLLDKGKADVEKILLSHGNNYVVQDILTQHPELSKLNESSVNTIRIMTLLWNDVVHPLSAHIRIGKSGSHYDHYGIIRSCENNGELGSIGYKYKMGDVVSNDEYADAIQPCTVPSFAVIREKVCELHLQMPYFKVLSWDFAIDRDGDPVLIEVNVDYPGINHHQFCSGPIFEDLTDDVLASVFGKTGE